MRPSPASERPTANGQLFPSFDPFRMRAWIPTHRLGPQGYARAAAVPAGEAKALREQLGAAERQAAELRLAAQRVGHDHAALAARLAAREDDGGRLQARADVLRPRGGEVWRLWRLLTDRWAKCGFSAVVLPLDCSPNESIPSLPTVMDKGQPRGIFVWRRAAAQTPPHSSKAFHALGSPRHAQAAARAGCAGGRDRGAPARPLPPSTRRSGSLCA